MEHDMLEKLLLEMSEEYPELSRVFINERDQFLSYSLRKCSQQIPIETNENGFVPSTVVGVVGIGHVQGIIKQWNQPTIHDIQHLLKLYIQNFCLFFKFHFCFLEKLMINQFVVLYFQIMHHYHLNWHVLEQLLLLWCNSLVIDFVEFQSF
jgi:pheromone shutdown protein TraB